MSAVTGHGVRSRTHWTCAVLFGLSLIALAAVGCSSCAHDRSVEVASKQPMKLTPGDAKMRCPTSLLDARQGGSDQGRYVEPTEDARVALRGAATKLVMEGRAGQQAAGELAARAGFELIDVAEVPGTLLMREVSGRKNGGGAYIFRVASTSHVLVQAPHTFFDEGTLPLACELFQRVSARALFIETAHRYKAADTTESGAHPADVAHSPTSLFQAVTDGVLRGLLALQATSPGDARVVQLHGFAPRDGGASIVLSPGKKEPGAPLVARAATELKKVLGDAVLRFPEDGTDLGATTNVQGELVRDSGGEFLHVEIVANLRRDLLSDPQLRANVLDALATALEGS